jgi:hypothetical protein
MPTGAWRIDPALASDLAAAVGWSAASGVPALVARIPEVLPCGSTAKLAAMERGEVPPGAHVDELAREVVRHAADPDVPRPSWSCWVTASITAAILDAASVGPVDIAAVRRTDTDGAAVDLHAVVVVDDGSTTYFCDPYFGASVALDPGIGSNETGAPLGAARVERESDDRWTFGVHFGHWARPCAYRVFAPAMDRDDVRAACAISTRFSGVSYRPYARLHTGGGVDDLRLLEDGGSAVTRWDPPGPEVSRPHASWADAVADFAARTGVTIA